jgi:hypothetical protein
VRLDPRRAVADVVAARVDRDGPLGEGVASLVVAGEPPGALPAPDVAPAEAPPHDGESGRLLRHAVVDRDSRERGEHLGEGASFVPRFGRPVDRVLVRGQAEPVQPRSGRPDPGAPDRDRPGSRDPEAPHGGEASSGRCVGRVTEREEVCEKERSPSWRCARVKASRRADAVHLMGGCRRYRPPRAES